MFVRIDNDTSLPLSNQRQAWLELIGRYDWQLFITLTFKDEIEPWKARKRVEKWIGSINSYLFGWRYSRKGRGVAYALGIEYQRRGIVHFHVLMSAPGLMEIPFKYLHNLWQSNGQRDIKTGTLLDRLVNGYAWVEPVNELKGVSHYLTKYISKGGEIDLFMPRRQGKSPLLSEAR